MLQRQIEVKTLYQTLCHGLLLWGPFNSRCLSWSSPGRSPRLRRSRCRGYDFSGRSSSGLVRSAWIWSRISWRTIGWFSVTLMQALVYCFVGPLVALWSLSLAARIRWHLCRNNASMMFNTDQMLTKSKSKWYTPISILWWLPDDDEHTLIT